MVVLNIDIDISGVISIVAAAVLVILLLELGYF